MKPARHYCCQYNDKIYIIDGENGEIILFDPKLGTFSKKCDMVCLGRYPACTVVFDKIHIFSGLENATNIPQYYYTYDIPTNTLDFFEDLDATIMMEQAVCRMSVVKYKNQIIAFGGSDGRANDYYELFISSETKPDDQDAPKWTKKEKWIA